jgi:hypothetical protein
MASSLAETVADLTPAVLERAERCIRAALGEYATDYAKLRYRHSKRSEASLIHDLMVRQFEREFGNARDNSGRDGVHRRGNARLALFMGGQYQAKLKKMDGARRTRNIPTQAALRFQWQEPQLTFEQIPCPTNLNIGYQPPGDGTLASSKVWVTCPHGNVLAWSLELRFVQVAEDAATERAKIVHADPEVTSKKRRTRIKGAEAKKTNKASGDDGEPHGS